jgi:hypothetical protein
MTPQAHLSLGTRQIAILIGFGALLWFGAAMLLRTLGPMGVFDGGWRVILYAAVIPGTWPFIILAQRLAGLARDQIAVGITIVTASAALLDGVAFGWFPGLYSSNPLLATASAGTILWGVGVGLVLGLVMNRVA